MAISPLEARATDAQLLETQVVEHNVVACLQRKPKGNLEFVEDNLMPEDVSIVLRIVAERFRRMGWHVAADLDAGRLIFNDATPEF